MEKRLGKVGRYERYKGRSLKSEKNIVELMERNPEKNGGSLLDKGGKGRKRIWEGR